MSKTTIRAVVQCKRYVGSVGASAVRDLYGAMHHEKASNAYLVTTGKFTKSAMAWAKAKAMFLVEGTELLRWTRIGRALV